MGQLSKFFCIAVAGATCDGRTISDNWISEMAETYVPATYTANGNIEHLRGISPEPPFNCQGKVVAVEERTIDLALGGKMEKRKALFAQVDANDNLVAYNAKGQKLYPSVEVNENFAGTGKAYLQGLAFTDSPASLGTEVLTFAASQGDKNFLNSRKHAPGNYFSAALPELGFNLEFEEAPTDQATGAAAMFAAATAFFRDFGKAPQQAVTPPAEVAAVPADVAQLTALIGEGFGKLNTAVAAMSTETQGALTKLRTDHDALALSIETTDASSSRRPPADGAKSGNYVKIDC